MAASSLSRQRPPPHLDDKHTVFGKVTKGFEVVSAIESVMTGDRDMPLRPVKVLSIEC
jgi:cyclophilin family peptidyl-prolyl cis-trans isomerase